MLGDGLELEEEVAEETTDDGQPLEPCGSASPCGCSVTLATFRKRGPTVIRQRWSDGSPGTRDHDLQVRKKKSLPRLRLVDDEYGRMVIGIPTQTLRNVGQKRERGQAAKGTQRAAHGTPPVEVEVEARWPASPCVCAICATSERETCCPGSSDAQKCASTVVRSSVSPVLPTVSARFMSERKSNKGVTAERLRPAIPTAQPAVANTWRHGGLNESTLSVVARKTSTFRRHPCGCD